MQLVANLAGHSNGYIQHHHRHCHLSILVIIQINLVIVQINLVIIQINLVIIKISHFSIITYQFIY